jgi:hypothetical protein
MSVRPLFTAVLLLSLVVSPVFAGEAPAVSRGLSEANKDAACLTALLQRIVDDAGVVGAQRLYVGAVAREEAGDYVRVYWPAQRAILIVDLSEQARPCASAEADSSLEHAALSWYRTKARIDLDTDVVPTPDDIGGSTYLVDKPWVDAIVADCLKNAPLVIEPPARE